jgi:hypothetical protein
MAWIEAPASHAKAAGNSDSPGPDATAPVLDSISEHEISMSIGAAGPDRLGCRSHCANVA